MYRTKLLLAVLAATAAISSQGAVALATSYGSPTSPSFITDTLAPGGNRAPVQGYRFITDTLAPGGNRAPVQGYRFITDTLAPGGGSSEVVVPVANGFDWVDAGIGAGSTVGLMVALLAGARLLSHRRRTIAA
jgi:hypothetical protein